eukprot:TRINITY_DN28390_c0_g3_i1.p1 TRINITY_DN28390_c0_g3~~TRINITY_DN28390_c0_g3_i1.p1  ORF type:complete len:1065 (-),score=253.14 TRINITY_DN28390_c0_g3_i1:85-3279(-)
MGPRVAQDPAAGKKHHAPDLRSYSNGVRMSISHMAHGVLPGSVGHGASHGSGSYEDRACSPEGAEKTEKASVGGAHSKRPSILAYMNNARVSFANAAHTLEHGNLRGSILKKKGQGPVPALGRLLSVEANTELHDECKAPGEFRELLRGEFLKMQQMILKDYEAMADKVISLEDEVELLQKRLLEAPAKDSPFKQRKTFLGMHAAEADSLKHTVSPPPLPPDKPPTELHLPLVQEAESEAMALIGSEGDGLPFQGIVSNKSSMDSASKLGGSFTGPQMAIEIVTQEAPPIAVAKSIDSEDDMDNICSFVPDLPTEVKPRSMSSLVQVTAKPIDEAGERSPRDAISKEPPSLSAREEMLRYRLEGDTFEPSEKDPDRKGSIRSSTASGMPKKGLRVGFAAHFAAMQSMRSTISESAEKRLSVAGQAIRPTPSENDMVCTTKSCMVAAKRAAVAFIDGEEESDPEVDGEEPCFVMWSSWDKTSFNKIPRSNSKRASQLYGAGGGTEEEPDTDSDYETTAGMAHDPHNPAVRRHRWMLHPNSKIRILWDFLTTVNVLYECVVGPLDLMNWPMDDFAFMQWFVRFFWTADLILTFRTGYLLKNGRFEMRPRNVAVNYSKTWLPLDVTLIVGDWLDALFSNLSKNFRVSRPLVKALRLVRVVRLGRIMRMSVLGRTTAGSAKNGLKASLQQTLKSEVFMVFMQLCSAVLSLLLLNHMLACGWAALSANDGWIYAQLPRGSGDDLSLVYWSAFHWSFTNFAGSMEIHPHNVQERLYAVSCLMAGFIIAAWFVGSLTSALTQLKLHSGNHWDEALLGLRMYLREHNVSAVLVQRIMRNVERHIANKNLHRPDQEIALLGMVSHSLVVDLDFEMRMPVMEHHPFFKLFKKVFPATMKEICHEAVTYVDLIRGEYLFNEGETSPHPRMYFVDDGRLRYLNDVLNCHEFVCKGDWLCEAILWTPWVHCGAARVASANIRLIALDTVKFINTVTKLRDPAQAAWKFGDQYVKGLNECEEDSLTDLKNWQIDLDLLAYEACPKQKRDETTDEDTGDEFQKRQTHFGNLLRRATRVF